MKPLGHVLRNEEKKQPNKALNEENHIIIKDENKITNSSKNESEFDKFVKSQTSIENGDDNQAEVISFSPPNQQPLEQDLADNVQNNFTEYSYINNSLREKSRLDNFDLTDENQISIDESINEDYPADIQIDSLKTQPSVEKNILPPSMIENKGADSIKVENTIENEQKVYPKLNYEQKDEKIIYSVKLDGVTLAPNANQLGMNNKTYKPATIKPEDSHINFTMPDDFTLLENRTVPNITHYEVVKNSTSEKAHHSWTTGSTLLLLTSLFSVATVVLILLHRKGLLCSDYEDIFVRNVTSQSAYQHNDVSQAYNVL